MIASAQSEQSNSGSVALQASLSLLLFRSPDCQLLNLNSRPLLLVFIYLNILLIHVFGKECPVYLDNHLLDSSYRISSRLSCDREIDGSSPAQRWPR